MACKTGSGKKSGGFKEAAANAKKACKGKKGKC